MDHQAARLRQLVQATRRAQADDSRWLVVAADSQVDIGSTVAALRKSSSQDLISPKRHHADGAKGSEIETTTTVGRIIDAGIGFASNRRYPWRIASAVVLVTTTAESSILAAYATLKSASNEGRLPPVELVVQGDTWQATRDVYERLRATCERFLALPLHGGVLTSTLDAANPLGSENHATQASQYTMVAMVTRLEALGAPTVLLPQQRSSSYKPASIA